MTPADHNDLLTDYPDSNKLRWRGVETGSYSWDQVEQMLRNREIGHSHETFWLGKWTRLRDVVQRIEADRRTASIRQQERAQEARLRQEAQEARLRQEAQEARKRESELEQQRAAEHEATRGHQFRLEELEVQKVRIKSDASATFSKAIAGTFVILIVVGLIGTGLYFAFDKWGYNEPSVESAANTVKDEINAQFSEKSTTYRIISIRLEKDSPGRYSGVAVTSNSKLRLVTVRYVNGAFLWTLEREN